MKALALACALLAGACGAAKAGLLVPDCKEDRAALDRFLASLPASCEKDSDCDCYYYNVFPEDGPVALRAPGVSQEQWRRLDDAQQLVRRACGPELAASPGRGAAYSYSARCDAGRCVRVKSEGRGAGSVLNGMTKPRGAVARPGEFFAKLSAGLSGLKLLIMPLLYLCAAILAVLAIGALIVRGAERLNDLFGRGAATEEAGSAGGIGSRFLKWLSFKRAVILVLLALMARGCYSVFGTKNLYGTDLQSACAPAFEEAGFKPQPGDKMKGGRVDNWMDASTFCRLETSPERTRAFTARVGYPSCQYYNAKKRYPRWWRGGDRPGAVCFETSNNPNHPRGVRVVIFDWEGLVFVEKWHS